METFNLVCWIYDLPQMYGCTIVLYYNCNIVTCKFSWSIVGSYCACTLLLTVREAQTFRRVITFLCGGKTLWYCGITMTTLLLYIVVAVFRKPLRLILEHDDLNFDCHVSLDIYIAGTRSPRDHNCEYCYLLQFIQTLLQLKLVYKPEKI